MGNDLGDTEKDQTFDAVTYYQTDYLKSTDATANTSTNTSPNSEVITKVNKQIAALTAILSVMGSVKISNKGKAALKKLGISTSDEYKGPFGKIRKFFDDITNSFNKVKEFLGKHKKLIGGVAVGLGGLGLLAFLFL